MGIEKMAPGEVLLFSLMGMLVVIAALAILAVCITLLSKLLNRLSAQKAPVSANPVPAAAAKAPAAEPAVPAVMATTGDLTLRDVDDQTAALLMAIISDQTQIPLNELRFKSIKCLNP